MERFKLLQTGNVAFQETNLEWHNKGYQDEFQKLLFKAFGAARVDHSTTKAIKMNFKNFWSRPLEQRGWTTAQQKTSLKHCLSNQEGLQVQSWKNGASSS
jgi:hypothetical protein